MGFNIGGLAALTSPSGTTLSMDSINQWMAVNASGILTRPQTPYMRGQLTGLANPHPGGPNGTLRVTADENIGSCWNNSTWTWTCPRAGKYIMMGGNLAYGANQGVTGSGYLHFLKNGVSCNYTHWNSGGNWTWVCLSAIVTCNASDTLVFYVDGVGTGGVYGAGGHCMYSIGLMI